MILSCLKNFSSGPTICQFFANAYPVLWQPTRWTLKFVETWNGKDLSCAMIVLQAISLMLPRSKKVKCTRLEQADWKWLENILNQIYGQKQTSNDSIDHESHSFHLDFSQFLSWIDLVNLNWLGRAQGLDSSILSSWLTLPETNKSPWKVHHVDGSFTRKLRDFPWRFVSLTQGNPSPQQPPFFTPLPLQVPIFEVGYVLAWPGFFVEVKRVQAG